MTSNRIFKSLKDAGVVLIDCVHKTPNAHDSGYPYIAIPQMKNGQIDDRSARKISEADFIEWTKKALPRENDVILSRRCNPGETAAVPKNVRWALGQNLVLLRSKNTEIYPPFLKWIVRSDYWWDQVNKYINVGAIFDSLKCADVPNFELPIPPKAEQETISSQLDNIENKIQLNSEINETLESIAKAIFKEWFIDFGPVKAKNKGKKPFGIDDETAALFPNSFEDSELGLIPKGWNIERFDNLVSIKRDSLKTGVQLDGRKYAPIDVIPMKKLVFQLCSPISEAQSSLIAFEEGDILFGAMRPYFHRVSIASYSGVTRTTVFVLNSKDEAFKYFSLLLLDRPESVEYANLHSSGSTIPYAVWNNGLDKMKVVVPNDKKILIAFANLVGVLIDKCIQNEKENIELSKSRDLLLPKFISGDLSLAEEG